MASIVVAGTDNIDRLTELLEMIHVGVARTDPVNNGLDRLISSSRWPPSDPPEADPPKRRLQLV